MVMHTAHPHRGVHCSSSMDPVASGCNHQDDDEQYLGKRISNMRVEGRRARGRPKRRWRDCVEEDLRGKEIEEDGTEYEDRDLWRRLIRNSDPV